MGSRTDKGSLSLMKGNLSIEVIFTKGKLMAKDTIKTIDKTTNLKDNGKNQSLSKVTFMLLKKT